MRLEVSTLLILPAISLLAIAPVIHAANDVGCVTSKCHETMGTAQFVHGPVGVGECEVCHQPTNEKDHEFTLRAAGEELCFACHDDRRDSMLLEHTHTPVANGECVGCHDPHQSDFKFSLKGEADGLCLQCHEGDRFSREHVHGPVASGDCNACHDPHASMHEFQLVEEPKNLCFICHEDFEDVREMRHVHEPVGESCTNCHDPHSNTAEFMLPDAPPGLCVSCHEQFATVTDVATPHPPAAEGDCLKCHDPHATNHPKLSSVPLAELCFSCHAEIGEYIGAQKHLHGPVEDGDCVACHNPHGSDYHRILKMYFPREFYEPYKEENYAMCFDCHNHEIAMTEKTKTLTDFRDGDRNLHYVHVNKDVKGRTCRACHQVHASSQEKHVRTSVPYGKVNWDLPVTFTKTDDGGSCQVGCHKPKEYSRK